MNFKLFNSNRSLLVHVCQHQRDVRCQQVIHFISQAGFTQELRAPNEIADGHVEVGVAGRPIRYAGKGMGYENFLNKNKLCDNFYPRQGERNSYLCLRVNKTNAVFVNRN